MSTSAGHWECATGSVRGASHARNGRPNQDAVRVVPVNGAVPGIVASVCDGHGGDRYVRSDVGSRVAVEVACAVGQQALADLGAHADPEDVRSYLARSASSAIVARWRDRVLDDVTRRAFTDDERLAAGAPLESDPLIAYGCTLLLAVFGPKWVGLLQIGDGDVTVVRGTDVSAPVPTDERLVGSETTSLCLPSAVDDTRVAALAEPLPDLVVLTSDGYANSFASRTWRTEIGLDLRDHVARLGIDAVEHRLPAWLDDSATAGGDDVSMALIHRRDSATATTGMTPPGSASATASTVRTPAALAAPRSAAPARRTGPGAVVAVAAVAALAGAAIGWTFTRGTDSSSVAAPPVTETAASQPSTAVMPTQPGTSADTPLDPSTTPPEATLPTGTNPPDSTPTLVQGEDAYLLLAQGTNVGALVAAHIDGDSIAGRDPVLLAVVDAGYQLTPLPAPWEHDADRGALTTDTTTERTCISVLVFRVLPDKERMLAVSADGSRLLLIHTATGEIIEQRPIDGAELLAPYGRPDTCTAGAPAPALQEPDAVEPGQETAADGGGEGGA